MLPRENSLTYRNDLVEHYRDVARRIATAPFKSKSKPPKPQTRPVERPGVAPEEFSPPDEFEAALAKMPAELAAKIRTPHPCTRIINETCREHGISRDEMLGPSRTQRFVRARMLAMWRCRQLDPPISLPEIGRHFGGRDHTTVMHAVRKIKAEMREHP